MTGPQRILLIAGSAGDASRTAAVTVAAAGSLAARGHQPLVWNLASRPLPMLDPRLHRRTDRGVHPSVARLCQLAAAVDGFLVASPVYHGSYSGVLKNCLDHLSDLQVRGKPVALAAHGHNLSAAAVCDQLRTVVRALGGHAVPEQLATVPDDFTVDRAGRPVLTGPAALARLDGMCAAVVRHAVVSRLVSLPETGVEAPAPAIIGQP
jgi:NAD(P)H-dependent FMN reductase